MAMFTAIQAKPEMQTTDHVHLLYNSDPGICTERIYTWHEIHARISETIEIVG
jgi:hypothetical protein